MEAKAERLMPQETQLLPHQGMGLLARDPLPQLLSPLIGQNPE